MSYFLYVTNKSDDVIINRENNYSYEIENIEREERYPVWIEL